MRRQPTAGTSPRCPSGLRLTLLRRSNTGGRYDRRRALATPATAATTRTPVSLFGPLIGVIAGSEMWGNEVALQARGFKAVYAVDFGGPGNGRATVDANSMINSKTQTGNLWGAVVYDLGNGGFTSRFTAKFVFEGTTVWVGTNVGRGFGDLEGCQFRTTMAETVEEDGDESVTEEGFVFTPGSCSRRPALADLFCRAGATTRRGSVICTCGLDSRRHTHTS